MRGVEGGEGLDGEGQPDQAEQPAHPLGAGPFLASRTSAMATSTTVAAQVTVTTHRAPSAAGAPFGRPTGGPTESMVPPHPAPGFNANPARFPKDHPMGVTRPSCHRTGSGSEEPLAVAVVLSLNVVPRTAPTSGGPPDCYRCTDQSAALDSSRRPACGCQASVVAGRLQDPAQPPSARNVSTVHPCEPCRMRGWVKEVARAHTG